MKEIRIKYPHWFKWLSFLLSSPHTKKVYFQRFTNSNQENSLVHPRKRRPTSLHCNCIEILGMHNGEARWKRKIGYEIHRPASHHFYITSHSHCIHFTLCTLQCELHTTALHIYKGCIHRNISESETLHRENSWP